MSKGSIVPRILVVDDVEEVLDALEKLLESDGYSVDAARSEDRAVECAQRNPPDLVLVNLGIPPDEVVATARRLKARARFADDVAVVLFCIESVAEGAEVDLGNGVYDTARQLQPVAGPDRAAPSSPCTGIWRTIRARPSRRSNSVLTTP